MKKVVLALAAAMFLPAAASAQINGVYGSECVREWTAVLIMKTEPSPGGSDALQRQLFSRFSRGDDPVTFMATACHMDRALVSIIAQDVAGTSDLSQAWNLPPHPVRGSGPREDPMCPVMFEYQLARAIKEGRCQPR